MLYHCEAALRSKQSVKIEENIQTTVNNTLLYRILVSLLLFLQNSFHFAIIHQLFQSYVRSLRLYDIIVSEPLNEVICFSADRAQSFFTMCQYKWVLSNYDFFSDSSHASANLTSFWISLEFPYTNLDFLHTNQVPSSIYNKVDSRFFSFGNNRLAWTCPLSNLSSVFRPSIKKKNRKKRSDHLATRETAAYILFSA